MLTSGIAVRRSRFILHSMAVVLATALLCGPRATVAPLRAQEPISVADGLDTSEALQTAATLRLANRGVVSGELLESSVADQIRFRSPLFVEPLVFPLAGVSEVAMPLLRERPQPEGTFCWELIGGDVFFADLHGLNEREFDLVSSRLGTVRIRRSLVRQWYRRSGSAELVYLGPNGLEDWQQVPKDSWSDHGGQLGTRQDASYILSDVGLPPQAIVEFELTWESQPNFVLALGVKENDLDQTYKQAHRFEIWDEELVVRCELGKLADVDSVAAIPSGSGRAHYLAYLDQVAGRMLVYSPAGEKLSELNVTPREPQPHTGIRLTNKRGDVKLSRLRVSRWDGRDPQGGTTDRPKVSLTDGTMLDGTVEAYDPVTQRFTVATPQGPQEFAAVDLARVAAPVDTDTGRGTLRVIYADGTRLSGRLRAVGNSHLVLEHPAAAEPLHLTRRDLSTLLVLERGLATSVDPPKGLAGRLETKTARLPGALVDGVEVAGATCLHWHVDGSAAAVPLAAGLEGRIVYRDPPSPAKPVMVPQPGAQGGFVGGFVRRLGDVKGVARPPTASGMSASLFLRSGDKVPCEVARIDEAGVTLRTPLSNGTFVPHDKIKALELHSESPPSLDQTKRERLLMLPRLQKASPPTQLLCSRTGDVLRGRIIGMDGTVIRIEIRLETKEIPRSSVGQIIWLHPDELPSDEAESAPAADASGDLENSLRVQAVHRDGGRLTFFAKQVAGATISGVSDVLGPCRADLQMVDQLLIGDAIEAAAAELAYHQWRLHPAIEPKIAQDLGASGDGGLTGRESPLVGKPAPTFALDLLDGDRFDLAQARGEIVILDFWATWCGPCMQSLPLVAAIADEFREQGVRLVTVNLAEPADQIQKTLVRHQWTLAVAQDRDGVVATRYEATAIPQTVIIDRDGNVARLFVGGGPHLENQLRTSLEELTKAGQ